MPASTRFPAIGTTAHLLVSRETALAEATELLRSFLTDLDLACSRFRTDSALSTVNTAGGGSGLDPLLVAAVLAALEAAHDTDGLVDPTLGTSMIAIGYDRSFADVPPVSVEPVMPVRGRQAWREIVLDEPTRSIRLPRGVRLDLGATAKAWAADVAASRIAELLDCGVLVNLGGDLAIAGQAPAAGWKVRVADDHTARTGGQVVAVRGGGVATSSTAVRTWTRAEQVLHHVLDPATGLPAPRVWRAVSATAPTCLAANTATTAALVLGTRAPHWLAARDIPARLHGIDGRITTVGGWPAEAGVRAA